MAIIKLSTSHKAIAAPGARQGERLIAALIQCTYLYFTGSFAGNGIRFDVQEIGSIEQTDEDGIPSGKVDVLVTIGQGRKTEKISGILIYGPRSTNVDVRD